MIFLIAAIGSGTKTFPEIVIDGFDVSADLQDNIQDP
jgi:hypothetical protein